MAERAQTYAQQLLNSVLANDKASVRELLYKGADANYVLPEGASAFHVAVGIDNAEDMTALFLHHHADPNSQCAEGLTPLHVACIYNKCEVVEQLLSHDADVNITDQDGQTALAYARSAGCLLCETRLKPLTSPPADDGDEKSAAVQTTLTGEKEIASSHKKRKKSFYTNSVQNILDTVYNPAKHIIDVTSPDHPVICERVSRDVTVWTPDSRHTHHDVETSSSQSSSNGSFYSLENVDAALGVADSKTCHLSQVDDPSSPPDDTPDDPFSSPDEPSSPPDITHQGCESSSPDVTQQSCESSSPNGESSYLETSPEDNMNLSDGLMFMSPRRRVTHYFPDLQSEVIEADTHEYSHQEASDSYRKGYSINTSIIRNPSPCNSPVKCFGSPSKSDISTNHRTSPASPSPCPSSVSPCNKSHRQHVTPNSSPYKSIGVGRTPPGSNSCLNRKSPITSPSRKFPAPKARSPGKKPYYSSAQQDENFPVVGFSLDHSGSGEKKRRSQRLVDKSMNTSHTSPDKSSRKLHTDNDKVIYNENGKTQISDRVTLPSGNIKSDEPCVVSVSSGTESSEPNFFGGQSINKSPPSDSSVCSFLPLDYDTNDLILNLSSSSGGSLIPNCNSNDLTLNSGDGKENENPMPELGQLTTDKKSDLSVELDNLSLLSDVKENTITTRSKGKNEEDKYGLKKQKPKSNITKVPSYTKQAKVDALNAWKGGQPKAAGPDLRMNLQRRLQELNMDAGEMEVTLDDEDFEVHLPGSPRYAVKSQMTNASHSSRVCNSVTSRGIPHYNESILAGYGVNGQECLYRPTTTSSRNASACSLPTPDISHIPGTHIVPGNSADISVASSACSCQSVKTVRVESCDDGDSFTLVEEHFPVTSDWSPCPHTDDQYDDSTLIYWGNVAFKTSPSDGTPPGSQPPSITPPDARPATPLKDSALSDEGSVTPVSVPDEIHAMTNSGLRVQLEALGDVPGPITKTTRHMYEVRLLRLRSDPTTVPIGASPILSYSAELQAALAGNLDISALQDFEDEMSAPFCQVNAKRHWREGTQKSSFNYLLLDPRVTKNLPNRAKVIGTEEAFDVFIKSVFYVGKGKRSRPYSHFKEAFHQLANPQQQVNRKVQHILDIWESGHGVVSLHVFQNVIPVEAYTREACMIEALGLKHLTNQKAGDYYGNAATWFSKKKRLLGVRLLQKGFRIFLSEGERQLKPNDIRGS